MSAQKMHAIWKEQCAAAQDIKRRCGLQAVFDYIMAGRQRLDAVFCAGRGLATSLLLRGPTNLRNS
jgi:hypothetical protein